MNDRVAEVLGFSDISPDELNHEMYGPNIIKCNRKILTEKSLTDGYYITLTRYLQSPFRDFESYLRILTGLNKDDIHLIIKLYNSKFETYKICPGVDTIKDLSEVLSRGFNNEFEIRKLRPDHKHELSDSILIDSDNLSLITKLTLRPEINALRFDEKSFFSTILGFSAHWDYKNIASSEIEYYSEKKQKIEHNK